MYRGLSFVVALVVATVTAAAAAADVPRHVAGTPVPKSHTVCKESSGRFFFFLEKFTSFLFSLPCSSR